MLAHMAERFYVNRPLDAGLLVLQGAEAHHLATVSRLRTGDQVFLFNGDGREYRAQIVAVNRREVELQILDWSTALRELAAPLQVACPLPRGDRGQFLVEKLTELGVTSYVPLRTARSQLHPGESRREKLERYVQEASKQCGRNVLMRIDPLQPFEDFASRSDLPEVRLLADPSGEPLPHVSPPQPVTLAVGPEGGFTEREIALAKQHGWKVIALGPRVLRVETAAMVLATLVGCCPRR